MKTLLLFGAIALSINIYGQYTAIPDQSFEQYLIYRGVDDIVDGQVLTSNITNVDFLDLRGNNPLFLYPPISDLTGINDFISLQYLDVSYNNISSLEVNNINPTTSVSFLTTLNCRNNPLTFLSVIDNTLLRDLNTGRTELTGIDLSGCGELVELDIDQTPITDIDLSSNNNLERLRFGGFYDEEIIGGNWITYYSPMTSINLANNFFLSDVLYYGGYLEQLDLSNCGGIGYSDITLESCFALTCLDLANGTNGLDIDGDIINLGIYCDDPDFPCSNLCIKVDDLSFTMSNWILSISHSQASFSEFCGSCSVGLNELSNTPKELIKIVDLMGRETPYKPNTVLIYVFDDGSTEKVFKVEL